MSSLEIVHRAVLKLSESVINLAQCDFILTVAINELNNIKGPISSKLKENVIKRCKERRTIWSDIFLNLSFDAKVCNRSFFYKEPSGSELEEAINFVEPVDKIESVSPESNFNLEDLINYASEPKRIKISDSDEILNFRTRDVMSDRLERVRKTLSNIRPTSIDSERCFSLCNHIITPLRTRLSDSKLDTIVFIYENRNN